MGRRMKQIYNTRELAIPDDVTCDIKSKVVSVKGPRGSLTRDLSHLQVDLYKIEVDGKPPIKVTIEDAGKTIEIRNFLGEKRVRIVEMLEGVTVAKDKAVKDQLILEGNDIENVSRSAAQIHQSCLVRAKDIRKFLDGVYVNGKGHVFNPEE